MQRVVVTGANRGIGLAIVEAILRQQPEVQVLLGARDRRRGQAARSELLRQDPSWETRVQVVSLDVTDDASVAAAADEVARYCGGAPAPLCGIVNNAGVADEALATAIDVNVFGMRRVCEAFGPLLDPAGGRVVNITSGAGPMFVAKCSPKWRRILTDPQLEWSKLEHFLKSCIATEEGAEALAARGLGDGGAYGLSKACANAYTLILARERPDLLVNSCTPGFIETDMTRALATAQGKSPSEMGMKPLAEGVVAPCFLLFGNPEGSGHFYRSDAKTSPLDRYRVPAQQQSIGSGSS